ncbi:MAG: molecular chaperone [Gammaproteobacteria bacterium]|nr:MAG: molecular chaperone [Gammaproteobacteria bacterium]
MARCRQFVVLLAGLALAGIADAAGLQVSPVSLSLLPAQNADGLWLSNTGDGAVHAQVRVYHWAQEGGEEKLTPSRGLVISPPMLQLAPGDKQLIRVIRVGAPPNGAGAVEDSYRVVVDELPLEGKTQKGLQFVLHYSIPVFVEPAAGPATAPQLRWNLQRSGDHAMVEIVNSGTGHAQIANMTFVDSSGHRTELAAGLAGYVLPGATVHWALKPPATTFSNGGNLEVSINGTKATQPVSLADRAH